MIVLLHLGLLPALYVSLRRGGGAASTACFRPFALLPALACMSLSALLGAWWDRGILWGDESAYRFQARIIAGGHLTSPAPQLPPSGARPAARETNFIHHIIRDSRWFTKYPLAWPALLAIGERIHARYIINPILGLVILWLIWKLSREMIGAGGEGEGALAVFMCAVSPYFFMFAASQMSHIACAAAIAAAALFFVRGVRGVSSGNLLAMQVFVGMACLLRPYTGFLAGLVFTVAALVLLRRSHYQLRRFVAGSAAAGACVVAWTGFQNYLFCGDVLLSPYALYRGTSELVEFRMSVATVLDNILHASRWDVQQSLVFAFPFVFVLAVCALLWERELRGLFVTFACLWAALVAGHLFQPEQAGSMFGGRYFFEAFPLICVMAAHGWGCCVKRFHVSVSRQKGIFALLLLVHAVQASLLTPPVLLAIRPFAQVGAFARNLEVRDAVVFLETGPCYTGTQSTPCFTGSRFNLNGPDWQSMPKLYLPDPGPARRDAIVQAQHRARWILVTYDPKTRTPGIAGCSSNLQDASGQCRP
ncbi:MAG: glycosyltransferase family 39 protein [Bryobacteraceae bacterium]|nr:glycosyltransferase family 39 protein [Bryobacteraceae bacterium]